MSCMRLLPEVAGLRAAPVAVRGLNLPRATPHLLSVFAVDAPKVACPRPLRRPAMILVDAKGAAVAYFRDGPFIAHPSLEALLAMHGLGAHELRKVPSVSPDSLGASTSPVHGLPGELQVLRRAFG